MRSVCTLEEEICCCICALGALQHNKAVLLQRSEGGQYKEAVRCFSQVRVCLCIPELRLLFISLFRRFILECCLSVWMAVLFSPRTLCLLMNCVSISISFTLPVPVPLLVFCALSRR